VRVEIPHDILTVQADGEAGAVEALFATFLQNLVSDRMEMELDDDYDERVEEIVQELEESGREVGLTMSPSRLIKEELIEREETSRESRKVGDRMVSNDSTEEIERIVIEDSVEGESYMIRAVGKEVWTGEGDEPVPLRNVLTPVVESTLVEGHEKERRKLGFRPLTALKKKSGSRRYLVKRSKRTMRKVVVGSPLPVDGRC